MSAPPTPSPSSPLPGTAALLDALCVAAVLFDSGEQIVCINRAATVLLEATASDLVGQPRSAWEERVSRYLAPLSDSAPDAAPGDPGERLETRGFPRRVFRRHQSAVGESGEASGTLETLSDITAQTRWEQEVARERERHRRERERLETQLEQIEKYKMELTANVTHDLRTPLASIKASVSGLLAGDVAYDPQALRDTLTLIEQETDRLQRRVQNLLSMSKMESGDALLNRDWADPTDIAATALESLRSIQTDREVKLEFQPDLPLVQADYDQLLIAVRNLLENAFLYSPADSPIELSVTESLGQIRFRVRDYGAGLMPDEFERIFDKFYRGRSARRIPGTGLGLPICRGIAEAHGGRLWAEHAPGGGVAFALSIPIEAGAPELEEIQG